MNANDKDLSLVLDVPVEISVQLGQRILPVSDVLTLGPGAVVELGKAAGESLDILVNGKLVARGEAVVVGEKYGVRITEVLNKDQEADGTTPGSKEQNNAA